MCVYILIDELNGLWIARIEKLLDLCLVDSYFFCLPIPMDSFSGHGDVM